MATVLQESVAPPVATEGMDALRRAVADFDREQLLWSSGYLAGMAAAPVVAAPQPLPDAPAATVTWSVFYATETGNSRRVAEALADNARAAGVAVELTDLREFRAKTLARIDNALFVVATHGIGEPPDGSEAFFEFLHSERAPRLEQLNYSVLALGDSSYADFCEMGRLLDMRLEQLGATRISDLVECDLDYEAPAADWTSRVVERAAKLSAPAQPHTAPSLQPSHLRAVSTAPMATRERPFAAEILASQPITGAKSSKLVHHIELDLEGSGIEYLPGDSLGVVPENPPQLVDALLRIVRLDGAQTVTIDGESAELYDVLQTRREVTTLSRPLIERVAGAHPALKALLPDRQKLAAYLKLHQVIDLLADYPLEWQAQDLVDALRGLTPRLYSIASSPLANPDEAHLTVAVVNYDRYGRRHWGAASNYLAGGAARVPVYAEPNDRFRLPEDGDTPIVMIGAGTGVAPYRAFVEHRRELGHGGDNWLIFGDRNLASDFLYQLEWLRYRRDGMLARLDVAFSRDRRDKVYVQQRIREHARELYAWLQRGAHIYVCGDADHMAPDVHAALAEVLVEAGGQSPDDAAQSLDDLKRQGRYQRDVY